MASFTLDDIRAAADAKFGFTDIEHTPGETPARLVNPLRLSKEKREALKDVTGRLKEDDADQDAIFREAIRLVSQHPYMADRLLESVGDDLGTLVTIFTTYSEGTQAGEASPSQD